MRAIRGVEDLGLFRVIGQPNLNFKVDRDRPRAIRSTSPTCRMPFRPRWAAMRSAKCCRASSATTWCCAICRSTAIPRKPSRISACCRPTGERVSLAQLCKIEDVDGASEIYREGEPALRRHQVQRARARPGQHGGRGHPQGKRAGQAAAGLHHRLGRRVRKPEARRQRA